MTDTPFSSAKRIVVKTGSALVAENGKPRHEWLEKLASDIVALRRRGLQIVLVSSGAVALGRQSVAGSVANRLDQKQAAAAIGQLRLMSAIATAFEPHDVTIGQCPAHAQRHRDPPSLAQRPRDAGDAAGIRDSSGDQRE